MIWQEVYHLKWVTLSKVGYRLHFVALFLLAVCTGALQTQLSTLFC